MSDAVDLKTKSGDKVTVSTSRDMVVVRWKTGCGTRHFRPDHLLWAIDNLEAVAERSNGYAVWMDDRDSENAGYACCLSGGRLHADAQPGEDVDHVSWAQFKKALTARARKLTTAPEQG